MQYSASSTYDSMNRLTYTPVGEVYYGDSAHADAATGAGIMGVQWSAAYDAAGNMTCRAPSAATCDNSPPTGNALSCDNEGRLTSLAQHTQQPDHHHQLPV